MLIAVLIAIILLITLAYYVIKRIGYEGKVRTLINTLKRKIFFNMLIA